jgi:hypothetical protein
MRIFLARPFQDFPLSTQHRTVFGRFHRFW